MPLKSEPKLVLMHWVVFCVVLLLVACSEKNPPLKVKLGQQLGDIQLKDLNGNDKILKTSTGKTLVINIWATWCGPCRHEMPSLDRLSNLLDKKKFTVLGISVDHDDHVAREFLIERKIKFENYLDPAMVVANETFGIRVFPTTFVIGPNGTLLKIIEGWRYWDEPRSISEIEQLGAS